MYLGRLLPPFLVPLGLEQVMGKERKSLWGYLEPAAK